MDLNVWVILLTTLLVSPGATPADKPTTHSELHLMWPPSSDDNNELTCVTKAADYAKELKTTLPDGTLIMWRCDKLDLNKLAAVTPETPDPAAPSH